MPSQRKFYKQVFSITVLSEDEPLPDGSTLEDIHYAIDEGPCVGYNLMDVTTHLSATEMVKELASAGSDPGFFQLDVDGNDVED